MVPADEPDRQSRVVYGVVLDDDRTATLVRRVMNVSVAVALFGVFSLFVGNAYFYNAYFYQILLSLLIPLCGYYGAKNRNEAALTAFCLCNLIGAILSIWIGIEGVSFWANPYWEEPWAKGNRPGLFVSIVMFLISGCQLMMCMWGRELAMTPTFVTTTSANPVVATYSEVVTSPDAEYAELK